jgi:hypothetical protein
MAVIFRARTFVSDDLAGCHNEVSTFNKPAFFAPCRSSKKQLAAQ